MIIPRWTVYPALALIGVLLVSGLPARITDLYAGAAAAASSPVVLPESSYPRVVVLGIDGMDPELLEETIQRFPERMPNFRWLIEQDGIHDLGTSIPPQSPVAWSNFITGRDSGGHGIYDFIHRNPKSRAPIASTVTEADDPFRVGLWSDWQLLLPLPWRKGAEDNRSGDAFWSLLMDHGVPADVWRMPANIPVVASKGLSFSGMLTPALDSAYGEFTLYTTDPPIREFSNGRVITVREYDGLINTHLEGPPNDFKTGSPAARAPIELYVDREAGAVAVDGGDRVVILEPGEWSDFVTVTFDLLPMGMEATTGIVRFYLRSMDPEFELYASPVNIDPAAPKPIAVSSPASASAELADRDHGGIGLYYTQGMAEEVDGLKVGVLSDQEFVQQTELVYRERREMMDYALDRYVENEEGGLLFFYYSSVDLNCHMLWRHHDDEHPGRDPSVAAQSTESWTGREGSTFKDAVFDLYLKMDPVLGQIRERLGDDVTYLVMSDHGFAPWRRKFSLNTWLYENGYLVLNEGLDRELPKDDAGFKKVNLFGRHQERDAEGNPVGEPTTVVDWTKTKAYGIGFNGLYLNLKGRELDDPEIDGDQSGIVEPGAEADALLAELKQKLEAIVDPEGGEQVVLTADLASDVYNGERLAEAPDIVVGYNWAYGNSDPSTLGRIPHAVLEDNTGGTFNGNHLMAAEVVSGVLMSNRPVREGDHALPDLTVEILRLYGVEPGEGMNGHPVLKGTQQ